jgi:tRNA-2-methylthio-N6-dimethylallyladenosine synthase
VSQRTVYLETFGCQMNELDSELVAGQLRALGYRFTPDRDSADVVLYNTCSVREHAEQKVWSRLGELNARKIADPTLVVGVLGCMAERDGTDLFRRMPVVDLMCGPGELDKLPALLDNAVRTRESLLADGDEPKVLAKRSARQAALQGNTSRRSAALAAAQDTLELLDLSRSISPVDFFQPDEHDHPGTHQEDRQRRSAYVRITRGCNKFCTYCVVPFTRGAEIHRPPEHILDECKKLADSGVIEITLLGQTVNHYRFEHGASISINGIQQPQKGRSFTGGHLRDPLAGTNTTTFADLLALIHEKVPSIQRLRFVTSYPRDFGDDVLEVIRDHPRICRYLHVPAQSGSDTQLKAMNRGYTVGEYIEFVERARAHLHRPEIGRPLMISSDFIVGFPGETDEDFQATVALIERCRFKTSFIFKYSPRPGTIAFDKLADNVPDEVKRKRNHILLDVQNRISDQVSREQIGRTFDVLVEGVSRAHSKRSAPTAPAAPIMDRPAANTVPLSISARQAAPAEDDCSVLSRRPESTKGPAENTVQLVARTDADNIVFFDVPAGSATTPMSYQGRIVRVRIDGAENLSLFGSLV